MEYDARTTNQFAEVNETVAAELARFVQIAGHAQNKRALATVQRRLLAAITGALAPPREPGQPLARNEPASPLRTGANSAAGQIAPSPLEREHAAGGGVPRVMSKRGRAGRARPAGARTARGRASQIRLSRLGAARQTGRAAAAARRASRRGHFRRQGAAPPPSCHSSRKGAGEWGLGPEGARQAGPTWRRTRCSAPGPRAAPGALEA